MNRKNNSEIFSSLLYIIVGVLLIVFRSQTLNWAMTVVGVIFIASGILDVIGRNTTGGAVSLIIGIAVLVLGWVAAKIVLLVLGLLIAIKGAVALINLLKSGCRSALMLVFPLLSVGGGVMLAFGNGLDVMIMIVGVLLAADGVLGLAASLTNNK